MFDTNLRKFIVHSKEIIIC